MDLLGLTVLTGPAAAVNVVGCPTGWWLVLELVCQLIKDSTG